MADGCASDPIRKLKREGAIDEGVVTVPAAAAVAGRMAVVAATVAVGGAVDRTGVEDGALFGGKSEPLLCRKGLHAIAQLVG